MKAVELFATTSPLLTKSIDRIKKIIESFNQEYRDSEDVDFDIVRRTTVENDKSGTFMLLFMNSNASDTEQETYVEFLEEELKKQGFIDGVQPVQVTIKKSNAEPNAYVLRFSRD